MSEAPKIKLDELNLDLSTYKRLSIRSVTLRELNGDDSTLAAQRAIGPTGAVTAYALTVEHKNQMIADSIVKVNGETVVTPYNDWQRWSLKTQQFVVEAFDFLNENSKEDLKDFRVRVLGIAVTPPAERPAST